jgi:hypothetical protein
MRGASYHAARRAEVGKNKRGRFRAAPCRLKFFVRDGNASPGSTHCRAAWGLGEFVELPDVSLSYFDWLTLAGLYGCNFMNPRLSARSNARYSWVVIPVLRA